MSLPSVKPNMCSVSTAPVLSVRLMGAACAPPATPSTANRINIIVHEIPSGAFFKTRTDQQCKNILRHPVEIQTHAHGCAVCRTVQISDEDFGGRSSRIGSALAGARTAGTTIGPAARPEETAGTAKGSTPAK